MALGIAPNILPGVVTAALEFEDRKENGVAVVTVVVASKMVFVDEVSVVCDTEGCLVEAVVETGKEKLLAATVVVEDGTFCMIAGAWVFPPKEKVGEFTFVFPNCTEDVVFAAKCDAIGIVLLLATAPLELSLNNGMALEVMLSDEVPDENIDVETIIGFISTAAIGCSVLLKLNPPLKGTVDAVDVVDFPVMLGTTVVDKTGVSFCGLVDLIDILRFAVPSWTTAGL